MILRRLIRNSSCIYPIYVKWVLRSRSSVFPSNSTDLHLTGFPRSANTYCFNIVRVAFPSLKLSTHIHTTASLKLAIRHSVPTIVLLRDPVSTCCSLLLKHHIEPTAKEVESLLLDYIEYHRFIIENIDFFKILKFEEVVTSPEFIVRVTNDFLQFSMSEAEIQTKAKQGQLAIERKEKSKAVEGSSLPNERRRKMKKGVEGSVRAHSLCIRAIALYESLTQSL